VKQLIIVLLLAISLKGYPQQVMLFRDAEIPKPTATEENILKWNESQAGYNGLSSKEQQFYYWVNYSRQDPAKFFDSVVKPILQVYPQLKGKNLESLESDLKNSSSLPLFSLNDTLNKMAAFHAADITSKDAKPSHNSTNGETFGDRFKKFNLINCGGENISYGAPNADPLFMLVLLYLDENVPDLGHRKALLNSSYINTGISLKAYKNGNIFLVEDFACLQK
jgi:hypothetical protein